MKSLLTKERTTPRARPTPKSASSPSSSRSTPPSARESHNSWRLERKSSPLTFGCPPPPRLSPSSAFTVLYTEAATFDPSYRVKAMQAASSAVQLIQLVADIDFGQLDIFLIVRRLPGRSCSHAVLHVADYSSLW